MPWEKRMKGGAHPSSFAAFRKRYGFTAGLTDRVFQLLTERRLKPATFCIITTRPRASSGLLYEN